MSVTPMLPTLSRYAFLVRVLAAVSAVLLLTTAGAGTTPQPDLHEYVSAQRAEHGFPGVALAVVEGGRVADAAGFGIAGHGRPMTVDTPADIGSIAKTITAVAVLQLVERGVLELDAPVRRYLPWFGVADPVASDAITVRHLLHHTSGISELDAGDPSSPPADATPEDAVRALRAVLPSAPVGTRHQYLNLGYTALALVVEATAGRPYPAYVRDHVFLPLAMTRSSADPRDLARPDLGQGHTRLFGFAVPRDTPMMPHMMGHGGITSTARDLARLLAALANQGELDDVRILSPASVAAMQAPPPGVPEPGYGFGWQVGTTADGVRVGGHNGAAATFSGWAVLLPDLDRGVVVLVNSEHLLDHSFGGLAELTDGVIALLADKPPAPGLPGRLLGLALLAVFVAVLVGAIRGLTRLPRWRERSRTATRARLVGGIAPHFVVPAVLLVATYAVIPQLIGRPLTLDWAGAYFIPDIMLIMAVAIGADLAQGVYKLTIVVRRRPRGSAPPVPALPQDRYV